ncbi:hypothetical protein [Flavisolibacter ginsenosidimutans]|uniref:Fibronectin type-III domain-containing protein n=1 Tax=Flavisolibacter ginsenosidimutans TaxID=661481 RepID=A0A5B8UGS9_9BACT|nr:hypothetical protein [Flavisolibacter ginsenosidimutans]QEC55309.1 hypothetical protein FSB75_05105 [Flavisolibacter ginsenosidimutans]
MRNKYFSSILILTLVFLTLTLSNCKKTDENNKPTTLPPSNSDSTLNKNVVIIDSTRLVLTSDTTQLNQGHLEFNIIGTAPKINVNDVLVGATSGGYIKRVSSVSQQGSKLIIESSQGTMEDVFNNARFGFSTTMDSLKNGRIASGYQFDVSGKSLYNDGVTIITLDKGVIDIDGNWNFGFNFKNAKLDSFELSNKNATFNGQFVLNVTSQASTVAEHTSTLGRIAKYNTFLVGGVPTVVYTEVELRCVFSASISATIKRNLQITTTNTANFGIKYSNGQWQNTFSNASNSGLSVGDRSGNANAEVKMAIVPYVSFRLYRILGPYASVGLKELVKGNVASPSLDWDFYAGAWVQTILGVRATIFGKSLFDYSKEWNTDTVKFQTPYKLEKTSGDNQTGTANQYLSQPLKVHVVDNNGVGESNVPVYFAVSAGGGSVETASILSDKDGYAQTRWKISSQNVIQTVDVKVKQADGTLVDGAPVQFAASANPATLATVTTNSVTSVTSSTATSGGNVSSDGGAAVTARGVCWSTSQNPTIANNKTSDGLGSGSFTSNITGLTANTTYYARAYATNSVGTAYGNQVSFTTNAAVNLLSIAGTYSGTCTASIDGSQTAVNVNLYILNNDPSLLQISMTFPAGNILYGAYKGTITADGTSITFTEAISSGVSCGMPYADLLGQSWTISGNKMTGNGNRVAYCYPNSSYNSPATFNLSK